MKTTTVALGSHFDEFIQASVLGGRYTNASEVIRAGLRRLEEDEQKIAALRAAIEEGEASLVGRTGGHLLSADIWRYSGIEQSACFP